MSSLFVVYQLPTTNYQLPDAGVIALERFDIGLLLSDCCDPFGSRQCRRNRRDVRDLVPDRRFSDV